MQNQNKKLISFFIKLSLSLLMMWLLLANCDFNAIWKTLRQADSLMLFVAFLGNVLNVYLSTIRWQMLLRRFVNTTNFFQLLRLSCLARFFNFFVPGNFAGDIIRGFKAGHHRLSPIDIKNLPRGQLNSSQGLASVAVDRIIGVVGFMILGVIGFIGGFDILKETKIVNALLSSSGIILILIFIFMNQKISEFIRPLGKIHALAHQWVEQFFQYIHHYRNAHSIIARAFVCSIMIAIVNLFIYYFISKSIGSTVPFKFFLFFIPIVNLISYLPITYNGLGLRESIFVLLFTQAGLTPSEAAGISLIYFGFLMVMGSLGGAFYGLTRFDLRQA